MADEFPAPRICETVTGATTASLRAGRDRSLADLVELRLDGVVDPDAGAALAGRSRPVIVTCRPTWEGGAFRGSEEERERLLTVALHQGAEYVDVEWRAPFRDRLLTVDRRRIVLSFHDFDRTPADLDDLAAAMLANGAAIVKIAVTARCLCDLLPLLALARGRAREVAKVLIAMGTAGLASRVLAVRFGSRWTYAGGIAPGQISLDRLLGEFRIRRIRPETGIYGLLGRPVSHSASPAMHNAAFEAAGIDAAYVPLEALDFDDFDRLSCALGVAGVSVTAPFKRDAFAACAEADVETRRLAAANTLRREADGCWSGRNTDVAGFLAPLGARDLCGTRVAVLGAGGAARAVVGALAARGARVTVFARRLEAAREVAGLSGGEAGPWSPPPGSWDVLVNATPVGTAPDTDASPMDGCPLDGSLVYDLVYNPPETRLLREARASGLDAIGGLDMLVAQAALQFAWWTGSAAPEGEMRAAARARLAGAAMDTERAAR